MKDVDGLVIQLRHENNALLNTVKELERSQSKLKYYLERAGWGECNIPACNCNGWHHLRQSVEERELTTQLHQRDTALASARVALEMCRDYVSGSSRWIALEPITKALSQICEVKK